MTIPLVRLWIWLCAWASLAGWGLSVIGQLNRAGYAVAIAVLALSLFLFRKLFEFKLPAWTKIYRRYRRPLPLAFLWLAFLILLGGLIYPPTHYVALTYHLPRVLQWLAAGRWHWIHTPVVRMNYSGCDFEWLFAPLLLLTKSDRGIFLLNWVPYVLLPGLTFSMLARLGVSSRVAWRWMWLLPTGYIFLLQAGSAGNDAVSAIYALAMVDFVCRAWRSGAASDLSFSLVAAAELTGTKPTGTPLLLAWILLILPLLPRLRRRWMATLVVLVVAAVASFLPLACMNKSHSGDWLAANLDSPRLQIHQPLVGILGNGYELSQDNLFPPFCPLANRWNHILQTHIPSFISDRFQIGFFTAGELPTEDWSGIGVGLSGLLIVSLVAALAHGGFRARFKAARPIPAGLLRWVLVAPWISLLAYCAKAGMATPARLIAPYYPLLIPVLLVPIGQSLVVRRRWWKILAGAAVALSFLVLIASPDRPLWPAETVLSKLSAAHPHSTALSRALRVYTVYRQRNDPLAGIRPFLPPEAKTVGFVCGADDMDISLWRPFGSRTVLDFYIDDPPEYIRSRVQYAVVGGSTLKANPLGLDDWLQKYNAEVIGSANATLKVGEGALPWYVVRFK